MWKCDGQTASVIFLSLLKIFMAKVPREEFCNMKMSKELADKLRSVLEDQDEVCPWTVSAEVLASIMDDEERTNIVTQKEFLDKCIEKFNKQLEENGILTLADIYELFGFEQESAPDFEFKLSKKPSKPVYKIYEDLAYGSSIETTRCHMLIDKLKATIDLLNAQQQYYEAISAIERDNEQFGFDLNI